MKKTICMSIIWMVFVVVNAFGIEYPNPTSWVNDYAGVLSAEQQQELDAILKDFENTTSAQIFVAIMDRIPSGISLEAYVNELFARWKPGQEGKDNGVLLAIFIKDRKLRIEVGYGFEAKLTHATSKGIITNDITPAFKQEDYYGGIRKGLKSLILTVTSDVHAQETSWEELNAQVVTLYQQGRYVEAIEVAEEALEVTKKTFGPDHPQVATSLNNLALLYDAQGRYAEAEPLYKRALAIRKKVLGPEHPQVATSLNNLAELYRAQGRYAEAEPLYKRALLIMEKALGPDHLDVATVLENLAALYKEMGNEEDAKHLESRAQTIRSNTPQ